MKKNLLFLFATVVLISNVVHAKASSGEVLNASNEEKLLAKVNQVYLNYSQSHPICGYQPTPSTSSEPQQTYTLTNPYKHNASELSAINFRIRNFVLDGHSTSGDPACGLLSIKCASLVTFLNSSNYYCERIHNGASSAPSLLADPRYNKYLAYQAIYNTSAMPRAQKSFGFLQQFSKLDAFLPYSSSQTPNPNYEFNAVEYSTTTYPTPTIPPSPNFSNGNDGFLFLGSAANMEAVCRAIQHENLSPENAAVRFSEFLGIPPDSPDIVKSFTFFKLRNTPHVFGQADGNMFRPCPRDGAIDTTLCSETALAVPHDCGIAPAAYDGTTVSSFLANQFYNSYCNPPLDSDSGMPVYYLWTAQGFTYDWYPWQIGLNHVQGAAEYVPAVNSGSDNIEVVNHKSLADFLATCDFY